jgi:hypothetical protein
VRSGERGQGWGGVGGRVRAVAGGGSSSGMGRRRWVAAPRAQWRKVQGEMRLRERGPSSSEMEPVSKRGRKHGRGGEVVARVVGGVGAEMVERVDDGMVRVVRLCFDGEGGVPLPWGLSYPEG